MTKAAAADQWRKEERDAVAAQVTATMERLQVALRGKGLLCWLDWDRHDEGQLICSAIFYLDKEGARGL